MIERYKRPLRKMMSSIPLQSFNPLKNRKRPLIKNGVGAVLSIAGLTGGLAMYIVKSRQDLETLRQEVNKQELDITTWLQGSIVFKDLDKLYLMRTTEFHELDHQPIRNEITLLQAEVNKLHEELSKFGWFFRLTHPKWFKERQQEIQKQLNYIVHILNYAGQLNSSLLDFKQRLYDTADKHLQEALRLLNDTVNKEIALPKLSKEQLLAHTYNLAAKIARCQGEAMEPQKKLKKFEESNSYYDKAGALAPNDPYIFCSQLALWGDMVWGEHASKDGLELQYIVNFLRDPSANEKLINNCQQRKYGLGLTNLAWLYLQAVDNMPALITKFGFKNDGKKILLKKALELAEAAVILEEQDSASDKSINAWLFRGLAKVKLAEDKDTELLEGALADFNHALTMDKDHTSLLRRKATTLEALGRDARAAYRDLVIELQYRLSLEDSKRFRNWLAEAKSKLTVLERVENKKEKSSSASISAEAELDGIYRFLDEGDYQKAYDLLNTIPTINTVSPEVDQLSNWFGRHFSMSNEKLAPKLRQRLLNKLGIDDLPTPDVLMRLSVAAYAVKHGQAIGLPCDWRIICTSQDCFSQQDNQGYLAIAFQHVGTKQIVIGHSGTDRSDIRDLRTDVQLALGKQHMQLPFAEAFTRYVVENYTFTARDSRPYILYHTGHSLGGAIASYMACALGTITVDDKAWPQYAVVFDSPSCWWQLNNLYKDQLQQQLPKSNYTDFPVTAYLTRPTFINCAGGPHLGRVMKLPIYLDAAKLPQQIFWEGSLKLVKDIAEDELGKHIEKWGVASPKEFKKFTQNFGLWGSRIKAGIDCHSVERINAAFALSPPKIYRELENIYYAQTWPGDLEQWAQFEQAIHGKDPLTYVPATEQEKTASGYALQPLMVGGKERIPLNQLESNLRIFCRSIMPNKDNKFLSPEHRLLRPYLHDNFFSWVTLSADGQYLEMTGDLSAWEVLGYLRASMNKACYEKGKPHQYNAFMYPDLLASRSAIPTMVCKVPSSLLNERLRSLQSAPIVSAALVSDSKAESKTHVSAPTDSGSAPLSVPIVPREVQSSSRAATSLHATTTATSDTTAAPSSALTFFGGSSPPASLSGVSTPSSQTEVSNGVSGKGQPPKT